MFWTAISTASWPRLYRSVSPAKPSRSRMWTKALSLEGEGGVRVFDLRGLVACRGAPSPQPSRRRGEGGRAVLGFLALLASALSACRAEPAAEPRFPKAHRDVAPIVDDAFSTEDARDRLGEAEEVMALAGLKAGMSVADVGAGEGYYTLRLARMVGPKGRVLAEDIIPDVRDALSDRVQ